MAATLERPGASGTTPRKARARKIELTDRRPKTWGRRVQRVRFLVQLGFLAFIGYVVLRHVLTPETSGVVVPSPEAYCPLGGFAGLYQLVTTGSFVSRTHASNLILFVGLILSALFARSFFCGWACPFGTIQEGIGVLSRAIQRRVPFVGRGVRALRRRAAPLAFLDRYLRYLKYAVLAWILLGTAGYGVLVFRDFDPWSALLTIAELEVTGGLVVLGVVLVASLFVERPWCRYACPLGATLGLVGRLSPIKVQREAPACASCSLCATKCPMGIDVDKTSRVSAVECNMCLQCVGSCPSSKALDLKLVLPGVKPRSADAPEARPSVAA